MQPVQQMIGTLTANQRKLLHPALLLSKLIQQQKLCMQMA